MVMDTIAPPIAPSTSAPPIAPVFVSHEFSMEDLRERVERLMADLEVDRLSQMDNLEELATKRYIEDEKAFIRKCRERFDNNLEGIEI